ncbi:MAG: preprotein translocase subunit SecA, partial [Pseudonocardia sp.]
YLARLLVTRQVPHEVLNAKQHERESHIVAVAGRAGAITVATNMAGRGTDIVLGGNPEFLADVELRERGLDPVDTREDYEAAWDETIARIKEQVAAEAEKVKSAGGLYVLGTERHESRRIDNQLRGRSGRQGDQGESRFYLSLGDDLMRRFNGAIVESIMNRLNVPDDVPIEAGMVTKAIRSAQTQVEQQNFEIRKNVLKYDEVLNKQRTVIYDERRRVLAGEDVGEQVQHMIADVVEAYVNGATAEGYAEDWDLDKLWTALGQLYPVSIRWQDLAGGVDGDEADGTLDDPGDLTREALVAATVADAQAAYASRAGQIDAVIADRGGMRELERQVLLQVLDRKWREHLYEMDYLKEGIGLRAMAQRDPLIEYLREGYDMFAAMQEGIKEETVTLLFRLELAAPAEQPVAAAPASSVAAAANVAPAASPAAANRTGAAIPAAAPGSNDATPPRGTPARPAAAQAQNVLPPALRAQRPTDLSYTGPSEDGTPQRVTAGGSRPAGNGRGSGSTPTPSRNRPCPCGSGRKYKQCHGSPTGAARS